MKHFIFALLLVGGAFAQAREIPPCLKVHTPLEIDNARVMRLEETTAEQYHDRARVLGEIVRVFPDKTGHDHFLIQIGPNASDTLEVVYNAEFGALPGPHEGQKVEACGDYITVKKPKPKAGPRPAPDPDATAVTQPARADSASPAAAIIHWVHAADPGTTHELGYLVIDGTLCGQTVPAGDHHGE